MWKRKGREREEEIEVDAREVFGKCDLQQKKEISLDEFVVVYSNILYPQKLSMRQVNNALRSKFGRHVDPDLHRALEGTVNMKSSRRGRKSLDDDDLLERKTEDSSNANSIRNGKIARKTRSNSKQLKANRYVSI
mmetsp:Transcript_27403/g.66633  ORF Transcript_27403/g.66633 Transcript_27403/m.66633 type:complete len:135 (+) Transcript_27403:255-659(+)